MSHGRPEAQFLSRPECKSAFNELDCALDPHLAFHRYQGVEVIWHDDEMMEEVFAFLAIVVKDLDK